MSDVLLVTSVLLCVIVVKSIQFPLAVSVPFSLAIMIAVLFFIRTVINEYTMRTRTFIPMNTETLIRFFKHGDVFFCKEKQPVLSVFDFFIINQGFYHTCMVIEEEGYLYVIHSCASYYPLQRPCPYEIRSYHFGYPWKTYKEPIEHFIIAYKKMMYQVCRSSKQHTLTISNKIINTSSTYCSNLIGRILCDNNLIDYDYSVLSNEPNVILNGLREKGYQQLFIENV